MQSNQYSEWGSKKSCIEEITTVIRSTEDRTNQDEKQKCLDGVLL